MTVLIVTLTLATIAGASTFFALTPPDDFSARCLAGDEYRDAVETMNHCQTVADELLMRGPATLLTFFSILVLLPAGVTLAIVLRV